jgi:hypothetical protein
MTVFLFFLAVHSAIFESSTLINLLLTVIFLLGINILFFISLWSFIYKSALKAADCWKSMLELILVAFSNIFLFTDIYRYFGIANSEGISQNLFDCLYFSIVTWTTLGYGDFSPTKGARFFAASEALLGYVYMAILIAILLPVIVSRLQLQVSHSKGKK